MSAQAECRIVRGKDTAMHIRQIGDRARDLRPIWPGVGDDVRHAMVRQFATEGAYLGKPWKPTSPGYVQWKVRHGLDPQLLVATGRLLRSLTSRPMGVERYNAHSATFGSDVPYARFHQHGTRYMPARPPIPTTRRMSPLTRAIRDRIADYLTFSPEFSS